MNIPYEVYQLLAILKDYKPLLVGGSVRDHLMGIEPKDFDTCTHSKQQYNMSLKGNIHFTSYIKKKHFKKFTTIKMVNYFS